MRVTLRPLRSFAVLLITSTAVIAGLSSPARAMNYTDADLTTWTWTDSARPGTPVIDPEGDAPVGATAGATRRAYFTYDLTKYRGQIVHEALFHLDEEDVTDCGVTAPIEVWRTAPVTARTTWRNPPRDLELLAQRTLGKGGPCPGYWLGVDVLEQVSAAAARRERTITFAVRVAASAEADPRVGRSFGNIGLGMSSNHAPTVSELGLSGPDRPCGTLENHPAAGGVTTLSAIAKDADDSPGLRPFFAVWPVEHPEQRVEFEGRGGIPTYFGETDLGGRPDGTLMAWSARARDSDDFGDWGRTCYFTVDNTAPATPPVITARKYVETEYPGSGGPGVPGAFILDADGDRDVVAFEYSEFPYGIGTTVRATHPGGRARVTVTPDRWGEAELYARSVDATGNRGPQQVYRFYVRNSGPMAEIEPGGVGLPSTIRFTSRVPGVTEFGFTVNGGPETRVPAVDDQGSAEVTFGRGSQQIVARSYQRKKLVGTETVSVYIDDAPAIESADFLYPAEPIVGTEGDFTFRPRSAGVVGYLYDLGDGEQRVEAGPDGVARLHFTASRADTYYLSVRSVTADGVTSEYTYTSFEVIDTRPWVWSDSGTSSPDRGGVGRPVRVSLNTRLSDVTAYVYSFDGGPEQTVDGSGFVQVEVVPAHAGDTVFTARARRANGNLSPATTITFRVTSGPLVTSAGPYGSSPVRGREATFTIKPALADVVSYRWFWTDTPDETHALDAAPDGSATLTVTPARAGYEILKVVSIGRDGGESDVRVFDFIIDDPAVRYEGTWDARSPTGGVGVPGRLGFHGDLRDATVKYLWRVGDGPVNEVAPTEDSLVTYVTYTPDRTGASTLYVQREFRDGVRSAMQEYTLLVGTRPFVVSATYPAGGWGGGGGVPGTFQFSGGLPGVVSFDYRFVRDQGDETPGSVAAGPDGTARVTFTPPESYSSYTLTVVGHTADGTATDEATYRFNVRDSAP